MDSCDQRRDLAITIGNFWIPLTVENFFASCAQVSFSKSDTRHQQRLPISLWNFRKPSKTQLQGRTFFVL